MCGGKSVHIVSFAVSCCPSVEISTVPGSQHGAGSSVDWVANDEEGSSSNAANNMFKHLVITFIVIKNSQGDCAP